MPPRHLYVHVPFCARRCTYCDFSIAVRAPVPVDDYVAAVERELDLRYRGAGPWELDTLYLGGGTPSKLGAEGVARLIERIRKRVTLAAGAEVTMEANPEDVSARAARAWRDAGVTRLSLGAQSFDDRVLAWMHRTHDAAAIPTAVETARGVGIDALSLDLIFALPWSLERDWEEDLARALALAPGHLSLYGLNVEPDTPMARWRDRGQMHEASEDTYEVEFMRAHTLLEASGYTHYEVSNYARSGREARHNSAYWKGVAYAGVGPSAHEFDGSARRWNVAPYAKWRTLLAEGRDPVAGSEMLTEADRGMEAVYLGLRTAGGLKLDPADARRAAAWVQAGWGNFGPDGRLRLTPSGWLRLDAIAADLTVLRSHY